MATNVNERIKGIQVHRPIVYGSHARLLTEEEKALAPIGHTHRWTVFFTSAATPPPNPSSSTKPPAQDADSQENGNGDMDYIVGGQDDLSYLIKKVTFRLHETYPNPNRVCDKPPFKVTETGWGEFVVQIRIQFIPESLEKPITLNHPIKLHHWGAPIEGVVPLQTNISGAGEMGGSVPPTEAETGTGTGTGTAVTSAANTPAPAAAMTSGTSGAAAAAVGSPVDQKKSIVEGVQKVESEARDVKAEPSGGDVVITNTSQAQQPTPQTSIGSTSASVSASAAASTTASAPAGTPPIIEAAKPENATTAANEDQAGDESMMTDSEIVVDAGANANTQTSGEMDMDTNTAAAPLSIASVLPVHSWQYDELIFSDPPRGFFDILNENPPTPLPAKNRRPRDQRDEYEKKNQPPASKKGKPLGGGGRGGSVRGSRANTEVGTPGPSGSVAGGSVVVGGIPGEPGSADVPLEFSGEMEKGEYNKLMDARRKIVEQMDKWRERLIAQEKELNKLKDEVKAM
ncbi:hypothetical protein IAT40_007894 [Kwoniella sp. CBS 6097]